MFVALVIEYAKHMRRIILSSVACLAPPYLSTLSHNRHDFRKKKKVTEHKMCLLISSITFIWNTSHFEKNLARYLSEMYTGLHVMYQFFFRILVKFDFLCTFSKNIQISNFMKIGSLGVGFSHVDGWTNRRHKANSRLSEFCERA